ncbi:hypothetical protein H8356DRAFT_1319797 [Neocallimastix lanati (nom. inval.)]|nr:hypothetical protein H8356DRAFT_1319797 [Neocallimastix sp. JGI-2020a]
MAENKLKRLTEDENQDSTAEPPNKKIKSINDDIIIENFLCKYFFIDKSLLIKEFLQDGSKIVCITRPSGYGKTTNLTMLRYFFEMNYENIKENEFQNLQNKKYFENLLISKEKEDDQTYLDKYQGKYPVIYLDFSSDFKIGKTFEATIKNFKNFIKKLFRSYKNINLNNLDNYDKEQWEIFQNGNVSIDELNESISFLCLNLNKTFNKKIILLIDNYESPILNTVNTSFFNEFYEFYEEVFLEIFKQDKRHHYLFKTFITRNLKVNEDSFKEINLTNYSITSNINLLLQNGYIEKAIPELINYEMLKKDYIEKHREIFWTLLVEYGYLIYDYRTVTTISDFKVVKLKVSTNDVREFIKKKFFEWKKNLFNVEKIQNTIDSLTSNYDEERIIEFLKDKIKSNLGYSTGYDYYKNEFIDKYYSIIYSLLSISDKYKIDTEIKFKENDNIRELLIIPKKNLKSNNNKNDIIYIIINYNDIVEKGCIEALDYNENLVFDNIELKNKYDKIIKFGIAFNEKICDVIYEINYGNLFKKKEMQKEMQKNLYKGEKYRDAINDNRYLIDKTKMISELIQQKYDVFLITRPRRFGKSLNLSMIKEFFEKPINEKENEDKKFVFDGLEVSKDRKNMRHFHKYPVIYLNFKSNNNKEDDNSSIINFLKKEISSVFNYYKKRIDFNKLSRDQQEEWNKIEQKSDGVILQSTIKFLCTCLKEFYKRRCIILIDEYDKIFSEKLKSESTFGTIKTFFSDTFKGNDYLHFGIVTGCLDIGLNELNSGANNFTKCSLLKDDYFSDCYGFTEDELNKILSNFNISDNKEKSDKDKTKDGIKERLKKKYDGYSCFSDKGIIKNIYNPFSVIKFIETNKDKKENYELSNYWVNTGSNDKLKNLIRENDFNFEIEFLSLLCGRIIKISYDKDSGIDDNFLRKDYSYRDIWKVLFFSGYLAVADEEEYNENIKNMNNLKMKFTSNDLKVFNMNEKEIESYKNKLIETKDLEDILYFKIPNQEVLDNFNELMEELNKEKITSDYGDFKISEVLENFINGIYNKDLEMINKGLSKYLRQFSSRHLPISYKRKSTESSPPEHVYQLFLMQLFFNLNVKGLVAEQESGYGIIDIGFPNEKENEEYIIIEIKVSDKDDQNSLSKACKEAINQIDNQKYDEKFKNSFNKIIKYGMAFNRRKCLIEMKENNGDIKEYEDNEDDNKT